VRISLFERTLLVAQVSNLLYRGFPIARAAGRSYVVLFRRRCHYQEPADLKSAIKQTGSLR
jgi:hypothetical protein